MVTTVHKAPHELMTWLLGHRRARGFTRGGIRVVVVGLTLLVAVPFQSVIASEVQMDRFWELELRGRVQAFSPSRLTIQVDDSEHRLSYNFQVIRDGRLVDPAQVGSGSFVILDTRAGSVNRIFLMEEEPR